MRNKKWFAAACCVLFLSTPAAAQNWPAKPVRLIVGFPPGGSTDLVARYLAEPLSYSLGQQVVVDNRAGANGAMGTAIAARSTPDGYTYLVVYDSHASNPSLQKHIPFDTVKDFAPIMLIASSPMVVVVNPASPYRTLGDLIAAARSRPGELTLGSGGVGSRGHLAMALLAGKADFKYTQVPYKGSAQLMIDLFAGRITMQVGSVFLVSPYVKDQRLRALAVTATGRVTQMPDVPTVAEQGVPGYEVQTWWGILAPAGAPKPILQRMHAELKKTLGAPETRERLEQLGMAIRASTPEEFARHIVSETELWGKAVRDSKISATE
ncbi:MAG: tripartite tricarboxylate transporter substrate binding protein [Betaproteobacteria bacterium]|nr:tripartite tricarboxylate transporter substrate binding protein [Betaproteobacteria bacterium]